MSITQPDVLANPNIPLTRLGFMDRFQQIATDTQNEAIKDFEPHTLTPAEIRATREETVLRIADVKKFEDALDAAGGPPNFEIENNLFVARVRYRPVFCRLFRINDLPDDVLTDVFRLVVWTGPSPAISNNWRLWLTWVCTKWRKMVTSDPTLWNAIWFRDPYPFARSFTWFDRSGTTPLDIRITDTLVAKYDKKTMNEVLDRLFTKISQIRILIVIVEDWEPALVVVNRLQIVAEWNCPMILERIEVHRSGAHYLQIDDVPDSVAEELKPPAPLFGGVHLPTFNSLSLNGLFLDWSKTHISNLTTLDLRRMSVTKSPELSVLRAVLLSSPNLYRLCLDGAGPRWQQNETQVLPTISLPNLKRLVCANFTLDYSMYIMRQIHAPGVRDLHLFNMLGQDFSPLFAYLTGRFPDVRMLTIYSVEVVRSIVMVRWLTSMRNLMYLRVANMAPYFLSFFLQRADPVLVPRGQRPTAQALIVCPRIVFLELNNRVEPVQAIAWIMHRHKLGCPLRKVYITKALSSSMTDEEHLKMSEVCHLYRLEVGATPPEEELLLDM
ncbi:hypothetical protein M378DRAFT_65319 [Amanita muscaria Koide BX008]|uniref:F-box domain-containing protein n=1 Tax=Amanita muscaria (strain Koide BX008) TaxID=946122 RepID=A0A0C2TVS6_AMAMK|nr:hypothetical protein M378DRAFT_65319 [Amanita muscaria Koide BX008]